MFHLSKHHKIGFVMLVYRLEGHEEGSSHENDVRLPNITYIETCLISKLVNSSKVGEKKN